MPLFELFRLSKAQERNPSPPIDEVVELVWENGQISTQIQSNRSKNIPLQPLIHQSSSSRETGSSSQVIAKTTMDEIPMSVPSLMTSLSQDDDLVPWLNHQSLDGYCSDFLPNVSPVTVNEQENDSTAVKNQTVFPLFQRRNNETESASCSSSLQYNGFQSHPVYARTRNPVSQQVVSDESDRFTRTQDPLLSSNKPSVLNFSHFLRPATLAKSNLNGKKGVDHDEIQLLESREEKGTQITTNVLQTRVTGGKDIEDKVVEDSVASAMPKENQKTCLVSTELSKRVQESEKAVETAVVCSSVGSGNSLDGPLEAPSHSLKRKHLDIQENDCQSEDVEEESGDGRKTAPSRTGLGSKRSRSAEVHNLSERRRRDRINEKMRALQELIPNCNKVDKASMLDEAIEYLKSLQLQVQIMSMASGYYMPPVMYPPGVPHRIGHYPPAAMAMGMGMGLPYAMGVPDMNFPGSSRVSMLQVPVVNHGLQFPASGLQQSVTASRGFPSSSSGSKDQMKMKNDGLKASKNQVERREASSDQFCGSS